MKQYSCAISATFIVEVNVEAENEEEAMELASETLFNDHDLSFYNYQLEGHSLEPIVAVEIKDDKSPEHFFEAKWHFNEVHNKPELINQMLDLTREQYIDNQEWWDELPETIQVFRGVRNAEHTNGYCWTIDFDRAVHFALSKSKPEDNPVVYEGEVSKDKVRAFLTTHYIIELICRPEDVSLVDCHNLEEYK